VVPDGTSSIDTGLQAYAEMLRESPHNLLSPKGLAELESRHFPESLAFAAALPPAARLLDVGSGGGLPGIVIAIARPDIEVHLLEATGKKARFLEEVNEALGLKVQVHHGRAEELAIGPLHGTFGVVTARAVAPLDRLSAWCAPYLAQGGTLHAIKGERWSEELEASRPAIGQVGLKVLATPTSGPAAQPAPHPLVVVLGRSAGRG
jgi:16S rRNA (guanine527-N7)-methyltransferase